MPCANSALQWERPQGPGCTHTLRAEGFATEVALEGLLPGVGAQVHVEVGLLGEGVLAELTDIGALVPAETGGGRAMLERTGAWKLPVEKDKAGHFCTPMLSFDVHLQPVATRSPVAALLADKQLLPAVLEGLVEV